MRSFFILIWNTERERVWTMSTGREVSKKSAFPTSFGLSTVFKGILWMKQVYKMIKIWGQFFFVTWFDRTFHFQATFQVFESKSLHGVLNGIFLSVVWILLSCLINVNFACMLNECPGFLKCKSARIVLDCLHLSYVCLVLC